MRFDKRIPKKDQGSDWAMVPYIVNRVGSATLDHMKAEEI